MTTSTAHGAQAAPSPVSATRRSPVLAVLRYAAYDLRRNLRMVESLFFVIVLPSALYLMFGALTEFGDFPAGSGNVAGTIAVSMAVYGATVATVATTSIAGTAAVERSKGWGRLLGLTPMRQAEYAAAKVLVALAIAALPVIVVFIVAALTGADIGPIATWISTGLITVAASAMFALYGLTFGLLFRSESAVGAASGLLVVLAFFGNLFMPLSGTLLEIAKFTPMYGLKGLASWPQMEGMTTGMNAAQEDSLLGLLVNVLAWTAIFAVTTLLAARRSTARA
ncbi:ABC transporter permease [Kocuria palustris]|uniref:ABC transporter permease n=1 Tax=Kocuria palustris TaxID=71999 RepID=UPI002043091D|nr:ABC transporter permease [Kocuria palustris]MCM3332017.1 ABC transporter permease [Kocuria palustris]